MKTFRVTLFWNSHVTSEEIDTLAEAVTYADEQSDQADSAAWQIQRWVLTGEQIQDVEGEWHEEYMLKPVCRSESWVIYDAPPARDLDDIPF